MKYLKLFESKSKYKLIKELPDKGCCECENIEQANILCEELEINNKEYGATELSNTDYNCIIWHSYDSSLVNPNKYFRSKANVSSFERLGKIEFFEYFEFTHDYRGLNLKKNFGL